MKSPDPMGSGNSSKRVSRIISTRRTMTPNISDLDTERHLEKENEKKPFKDRMIANLKFLNTHRKSMLIFNAAELTKEEPARKKVILSSFLKPLAMTVIGLGMFFSIITASLDKLGSLKS